MGGMQLVHEFQFEQWADSDWKAGTGSLLDPKYLDARDLDLRAFPDSFPFFLPPVVSCLQDFLSSFPPFSFPFSPFAYASITIMLICTQILILVLFFISRSLQVMYSLIVTRSRSPASVLFRRSTVSRSPTCHPSQCCSSLVSRNCSDLSSRKKGCQVLSLKQFSHTPTQEYGSCHNVDFLVYH